MKFAELDTGVVIEAGPRRVDQAEILAFATAHDPQWFHIDPPAALDGPYHGLIASGFHTCSIAMRLIVDTILRGSECYGAPGLAYVKWPNPVRPGDDLRLRATVLERRLSRSRDTLGLVRWRWQLFNAAGDEVLDMEATNLFDLSTR
jgi:acyl dehydratase